jgi:integrase
VDSKGEVPATTYHRRLTAVLHFLDWALRWDNAGSPQFIGDDEHVRFVWLAQQRFREWGAERPLPEALTPEPLQPLDVHFVRRALGTDEFGRWHYHDVFLPETRLRNWAMFEMAINYGLRRAELLLLCIADLPDDHDPLRNVRVVRTREQKAADKGLSRKTPRLVTIPALDPTAYDVVQQYLTHGTLESRRVGPSDDDARVFVRTEVDVTRPGARRAEPLSPLEPISGARYGQIIKRIGELAWEVAQREIKAGKGVVALPTGTVSVTGRMLQGLQERLQGLHPHVLRHTWATNLALANYDEHGFEGVARLLQMYGGWADDKMPTHYARTAMEQLSQRAAADRLNAFSAKR